MANKLGDIMFPNGTYLKEGVEKTRWLKCGVVLQTDKGMRIKLDALPVNLQEGWFSIFEDNEQKQSQTVSNKPAPSVVNEPDLPF